MYVNESLFNRNIPLLLRAFFFCKVSGQSTFINEAGGKLGPVDRFGSKQKLMRIVRSFLLYTRSAQSETYFST